MRVCLFLFYVEQSLATITKAFLAKTIAERLNITQGKAKLLVNELVESLSEAVIQGDRIEIRGFGVWRVRELRAIPNARNPGTGEKVYVPARRKVTFRPGKILRKELCKPIGPSLGAARILLIDDDEAVRAPLRKMLELGGYEVEEAANGKEGLEKYHEKPADVVIVDIFMPQKSGLEVIQELVKDYGKVKLIAISAVDIRNGIDLASLTRNHDVVRIEKPVRMKVLLDAVKGLLEKDQF